MNSNSHSKQALLVLSFGGPEKPEDVVPFLENVTRGRGIPRERLEAVGEHYFRLGGRSPINDQNKQLIENIKSELRCRHLDLPVYFGNRNWEPYVEDTLKEIASDGVTEVFVFATSAWGGYSGCGQYNEDIRRAIRAVDEAGLKAPLIRKLPHFHDHPALIAQFALAVDQARNQLSEEDGMLADLVFTAHSVPCVADAHAGPRSFGGNLYSQQVLNASRLIQEASSFAGRPGSGAHYSWTGKLAAHQTVGGRGDGPADTGVTTGVDLGVETSHTVELVWQSRSGSPHTPWLEPDVCDHIEARAKQGNTRPIILCPVGFITDHVEVLWDLDTEARDVATKNGIKLVRAATPGLSAAFASMVVELAIDSGATPASLEAEENSLDKSQREAQEAARAVIKKFGTVPNFGESINGVPCSPGCCG